MSYAISHSDRYKAAVLVEGLVALPELYVPPIEYFNPDLVPFYGGEIMTRLIGFDPVQQVWADPFKMHTPLLIRWADSAVEGNRIQKQLRIDTIDQLSRAHFIESAGGQTLKLIYAYRKNQVPIDVIIDHDAHTNISPIYLVEWQSRLLQWFDYFLLHKGENPIPAMKSPVNYTEQLKRLESETGP